MSCRIISVGFMMVRMCGAHGRRVLGGAERREGHRFFGGFPPSLIIAPFALEFTITVEKIITYSILIVCLLEGARVLIAAGRYTSSARALNTDGCGTPHRQKLYS